jgi:DNA mismatch repair protein MutS2
MGKEFDRGLEGEGLTAGPSRPARPEEIEDGTPVAIPALGWRGTALGTPGDDGRVMVAVGSFRVELPVSALEILREGAGAKRAVQPALVEGPVGTQSLEIDLRGCTVEEALAQVDQTLDGLVVSGGSWIRIIHGKGTGALRTAITEQLQKDSRVKSFRLGEPGEGGSGVTIAVLN